MPDEQRQSFLEDICQIFPAKDRAVGRELLGALIRRKQTMFAHINRVVVNFRVRDVGDGYHLVIVSLIPSERQDE